MLNYRFANEDQKRANLAILRDLMVDSKDDQPAKTALSNAITMAEATMVVGQLDDMMRQAKRLYWFGAGFLSVFLAALIGFQVTSGQALSAIGTAIYLLGIWGQVWLQSQFFTVTKWLEGFTMDLPTLPRSLI